MAIITISHQMATGGPEIGMALAKRLDYRYVDQDLISDAARRYGCVEERLSHLDESKPSLFERFDVETRRYITVIQTALLEFAETDDIVLMGRGGQWLLRGIPHVLRVRITERFEPRVRNWVRRTAELTGETPNQRAATEFVRRDDNDRAGAGSPGHASGDAQAPDHGRGHRRGRHPRGRHRGAGPRGRGRPKRAGSPRRQDAAGGDSPDPAVRRLTLGARTARRRQAPAS